MRKLSKICKKLIFILAIFLVVLTPFIFTGVNTELFEFNKIMFVYTAATLMTSCWLVRMIVNKQIIFKQSFFDIPLLIFLISQILSTLFSIHPRTSIFGYYTRFHGGLLSTIAYSLIYWVLVNNISRKQFKALLLTSGLAALGVSLYALPERILGVSPSCIILYQSFDTSCWVQDVQARVFATFGQPNWLAAYLSMTIPVQLYFFLHPIRSTRILKLPRLVSDSLFSSIQSLLWLAAAIASTTALIFTQSRSGLMSLGVSLFLLVLLRLLFLKERSKNSNRRLIAAVISFLFLFFLIGTEFTPSLEQTLSRLSIKVNQSETSQELTKQPTPTDLGDQAILITPSENIRLVVWQGAINVWQDYLWTGSGPETFAYSYYQGRPLEHNLLSEWDFLYNKAHNEFLNYLATTGLIGFTSYILLMGSCFFLAGKLLIAGKYSSSNFDLILAAGSGLLAFNISNFWGFSTVSVTIMWMVIMGFLSRKKIESNSHNNHQSPTNKRSTAAAKTRQEKSKSLPKTKKAGVLQLATLLSLFLVTAHLLLSLVSIWQADYFFNRGKAYAQVNDYQAAVEYLKRAVLLSPKEALFYDEMAHIYASAAVELQLIDDKIAAKEFAELAIAASDQALDLNQEHLNFHQTRASVFSKLSQIDSEYLNKARESFINIRKKAPTYPKPIYHQAIIEWSQGDKDEAIRTMNQAIQMKTNYHNARYRLGQFYEAVDNCAAAKEQYQYILDHIIPNDPNLIEKIEDLDC